MKRIFLFLPISVMAALLVLAPRLSSAQQSPALTWDQVKAKFEAANPALRADALGVDEMKAAEITAFLRPNPGVGLSSDGLQIAPHTLPGQGNHWLPLTGTQLVPSISYLHERERKRELRLQSAKEGTQIAQSEHIDLERNLLFNLRAAFVDTLQDKAVLDLARADLEYYDKIIAISRNRFHAGDIAQIDLDRIELLRVQYEVEIQTAIVNLRTAKIQLLQMLDERTPVEQFDVTGPFDFSDDLKPLEDFRQIALDERPDLRAALESIQQAQTNHKLAVANGSADPTFATWYSYNPAFNNPYGRYTLGASVNIPLRIFDRNQGEKQRTQIDIGRNQQLTEAARAAGLQRRGLGLRAGGEQHRAAPALQGAIQGPGPARARHGDLFLPARRRIADGLSQRAERLPGRPTGLSATDRLLSDRRRTTESSRGTRGNPMIPFSC